MRLKIKFLQWSAGLPVAMLNINTAKQLGVHAKDRVFIEKPCSKKQPEFSTIIDTVEDLVKPGEIAVSSEIKKRLSLKKSQIVDVVLAPSSLSLDFIKKKLKGQRLKEKEIVSIIDDVVDNSLSEAEIALFISAMSQHGMNFKETVDLVKAILESGNKLRLSQELIVDKHSIGGVAGNRTTPIIVPICTAFGLTMPKTSSRAITSAAGTADVIEVFANVEFSADKLKKIVNKTKGCMVWGGSLGLVPADSKIIQIEKMLGLDPEAQLLASIMSKKLAMGSDYILIDIPYGNFAKVTKKKAFVLRKKFYKLARYFKIKVKVILTDGNSPIGRGIGPALELRDVLAVLDPAREGPKDLEDKSVMMAGKILEMSGKVKKGSGEVYARKILISGRAFKKFKEIIKAQGGKIKKLRHARNNKIILAKRSGILAHMPSKKINTLARILGCPNEKYSGVYLNACCNKKLKKGQPLATLYSESRVRIKNALEFIKKERLFILE